MTKSWAETKVAIGGLMRCCTSTLAEAIENAPETEAVNEQTIQCKYTDNPSHNMKLIDGVWHWNPNSRD